MDYAQAADRFRAISNDRESPWRQLGRYLAARANIRRATVPVKDGFDAARLTDATEDLRAVLADPSASSLHQSARGLLAFIDARLRPVPRLRELSNRLTSATSVDEGDLVDYRYILNRLTPSDLDTARADDLTDWILTVRGNEPAPHAYGRWRTSSSPSWLAAALLRATRNDPNADALIEGARELDPQSPAFATVAFLRVRLLIELGRVDDARQDLASLPTEPAVGISNETINLFRAERLMLARTLDEFLQNAPRAVVFGGSSDGSNWIPNGRLALKDSAVEKAILDVDATNVLNSALPLQSLVQAADSPRLSERYRRRIAVAALTRALLLKRPSVVSQLRSTLHQLAPVLDRDLNRYSSASDATQRDAAATVLLLNTPGSSIDVRAVDDDYSILVVEPAREFDHVFRRNWWCAEAASERPLTVAGQLFYRAATSTPPFVSMNDRQAAAEERQAIESLGAPRVFLARAALRMGETDDALAPEALARVVDGWQWACGEDRSNPPLPQQASAMLHRRFPTSAAARRTKYWYRD